MNSRISCAVSVVVWWRFWDLFLFVFCVWFLKPASHRAQDKYQNNHSIHTECTWFSSPPATGFSKEKTSLISSLHIRQNTVLKKKTKEIVFWGVNANAFPWQISNSAEVLYPFMDTQPQCLSFHTFYQHFTNMLLSKQFCKKNLSSVRRGIIQHLFGNRVGIVEAGLWITLSTVLPPEVKSVHRWRSMNVHVVCSFMTSGLIWSHFPCKVQGGRE